MKNESMPAFPLQFGNDGCPLLLGLPENSEDMLKKLQPAFGLTKLEWFVGLALQGDWASQGIGAGVFESTATDASLSRRAGVYVRAAQALIAELEKHQ